MLAVLYDARLIQDALNGLRVGSVVRVEAYNALVALFGSYRDAMLDEYAARGNLPLVSIPANVGSRSVGPLVGYADVPPGWRTSEAQLTADVARRAQYADAAALLLSRLRGTSRLVPLRPAVTPSGATMDDTTGVMLTGEIEQAAWAPTSVPDGFGIRLDRDLYRPLTELAVVLDAQVGSMRTGRAWTPSTTTEAATTNDAIVWSRQYREASRRGEGLALTIAFVATATALVFAFAGRRRDEATSTGSSEPSGLGPIAYTTGYTPSVMGGLPGIP